MASELLLPLVVMVPLLITVFEPPVAVTPFCPLPVVVMLPFSVMVRVLPPVTV